MAQRLLQRVVVIDNFRKMPLRIIFIIFSMLILCSCDHFDDDKEVATVQAKKDAKQVEENVDKSVTRMANNVRDSVKRTNDRLREWWLTPLPKEVKKPIPTRYCYKVLQDILCYRQQMAGWENKLVGYQGTNAEPPTPATMKLLPQRADNLEKSPANVAAKATPVFAAIPTGAKESRDSSSPSNEPITIDSMHETLQDPALAPQL